MKTMNTTQDLVLHIESLHGPRRALSLQWLIPLTSVYVIILISGLVGNFITILVIFRFRYMQTITNLYLCNLAITDLISLMLSLPLELYTIWHQYPWQLGEMMCHVKTLVLEGTANASVLTLVTFTVERYLAICGSTKPVNQNLFNPKSARQTKKIALRNITLIWLVSLCGASPMVAYTRINHLTYNSERLEESAWCGLAYNQPQHRWEWVLLSSTVLFFLIPLVMITLLYYRIARKLKRATRLDSVAHSDMQLTDHATSRKIVQSRKLVIRMLVVIVIVFTFCWSPFHAQRLLFLYVSLYSDWTRFLRRINEVLYFSAGCLYYLNSSINPLIYSLLSTRFRAAFMLYVHGCYWSKSSSANSGSNAANGNGSGTSGQRSLRGNGNICNGHKGSKNNSHNSLVVMAVDNNSRASSNEKLATRAIYLQSSNRVKRAPNRCGHFQAGRSGAESALQHFPPPQLALSTMSYSTNNATHFHNIKAGDSNPFQNSW